MMVFFSNCMDGKYGNTVAYWSIYVINKVYLELQRAVHMNDVDGYIHVLPSVIYVFFAFNLPNYARWESLFLHKLRQAHAIVESGAMSIRRTQKTYRYARCPVDLALEQTVNRNAASPIMNDRHYSL
jgi:hypothetical protein